MSTILPVLFLRFSHVTCVEHYTKKYSRDKKQKRTLSWKRYILRVVHNLKRPVNAIANYYKYKTCSCGICAIEMRSGDFLKFSTTKKQSDTPRSFIDSCPTNRKYGKPYRNNTNYDETINKVPNTYLPIIRRNIRSVGITTRRCSRICLLFIIYHLWPLRSSTVEFRRT